MKSKSFKKISALHQSLDLRNRQLAFQLWEQEGVALNIIVEDLKSKGCHKNLDKYGMEYYEDYNYYLGPLHFYYMVDANLDDGFNGYDEFELYFFLKYNSPNGVILSTKKSKVLKVCTAMVFEREKGLSSFLPVIEEHFSSVLSKFDLNRKEGLWDYLGFLYNQLAR